MPNPFNPGFGRVPKIFIDREAILKTTINGIKEQEGPYQTTLVCGQRGTGKTVFLTDVLNKIKAESDWMVVNLILNKDMVSTLIQSVYKQSSSYIKKVLDSINGVKLSAFGIELHYQRSQNGWENQGGIYQLLLEDVLEKLKNNGIHLLIAIDEVMTSPEMRNFASLYQLMVREDFNISLIMTGLPKSISELQNDEQLTFLLRSTRIELPTLNVSSVKSAYKNVFADRIGENALDEMSNMVLGYAYAFQLLGYLAWNCSGEIISDTIDSITGEYKKQLYRNAYMKIYQELPEIDKRFVISMASIDSGSGSRFVNVGIPIEKIEKTLREDKKNVYQISICLNRLIDAGVIYREDNGAVRFCLPFYRDYILEKILMLM